MADINVNDLVIHNTSGTNLFDDSESFMKELTDDSEQVIGGIHMCWAKTGLCGGFQDATCGRTKPITAYFECATPPIPAPH
jgi:hypothetical protein